VKDLRRRWTVDEAGYEFGRDLFVALDAADRPAWAANVLAQCQSAVDAVPEIERILEIAADASRWKEGHVAFDATRDRILALERTPSADVVLVAVLTVAETTAKIINNESTEPAPFDYDAGWKLAPRSRHVADLLSEATFEERLWTALSRPLQAAI
jgi:hypothetical protein